MSQNPEWKTILLIGFILGFMFMGLLSYLCVTRDVKSKQVECELNIPRNQHCIMQFIPEPKK